VCLQQGSRLWLKTGRPPRCSPLAATPACHPLLCIPPALQETRAALVEAPATIVPTTERPTSATQETGALRAAALKRPRHRPLLCVHGQHYRTGRWWKHLRRSCLTERGLAETGRPPLALWQRYQRNHPSSCRPASYKDGMVRAPTTVVPDRCLGWL
jgi:hypothetical protein